MKRIKLICSLIILFCFILIGKSQTISNIVSDNNRIEILEIKHQLEISNRRIMELEAKIHNLEIVSEPSAISNFANSVISWSAMLFSLFIIIVGFAGWFAAKRFYQIDEIRKFLEKLHNETKERFEVELNNIEILKKDFKQEKDLELKVLFPLIEGQWFFYQGDNNRAISSFEKIRDIAPHRYNLYSNLFLLWIDNGKVNEAVVELEKLTKLHPENYRLKYYLAIAYKNNSEYEIATSILKEIKNHESIPEILNELGSICLYQHKYKEAEIYLQSANRLYISKTGSPRFYVYSNIAIAEHFLGDKKQCHEMSKKALTILYTQISLTPNNSNLNASIGLIYFLMGNDFEKSLSYFEKSVEFGLPILKAKGFLIRINQIVPKTENLTVVKIKNTLKNRIKESIMSMNQ